MRGVGAWGVQEVTDPTRATHLGLRVRRTMHTGDPRPERPSPNPHGGGAAR